MLAQLKKQLIQQQNVMVFSDNIKASAHNMIENCCNNLDDIKDEYEKLKRYSKLQSDLYSIGDGVIVYNINDDVIKKIDEQAKLFEDKYCEGLNMIKIQQDLDLLATQNNSNNK